jgi:ketol-acid reductoisomerase
MAQINFGGVEEEVITRDEFPLSKAQDVLKGKKVAVLGYGVQGPGQALNLRDNGVDVIVGQRKGGNSYQKALDDGWVEGETLFSIEEATKKADIVMYLLSDAGQKAAWSKVEENLEEGNTLYFSHGFGIVFNDKTKIEPPKNIDVILVAPKGSGTSVRNNFLEGSGINSSMAVYQDYSGHAEETAKALGIAVGSGYLFKTTFEKEVYSDLTGERGILIGALAGLFDAQYQVLRENGH